MIRRLFRADAGTSMVEFALTAPVFVLLLMGLIEVGRYTYMGILAAHAAHAAVSYGSQNLQTVNDGTGMTNAARTDGQNISWAVAPTYYCTVAGSPIACPGNNGSVSPQLVYYVQVTVSSSFTPLFHYPGLPSANVSSTAVMRVQNQ